MKTIKNYKQLKKLSVTHQVTAQEIINSRLYITETGWTTVMFPPEFMKQFADEVSFLLGGREKTKRDVRRTILFSKPQHWGLSRVILSEYDGNIGWEYIPGQDGTWEKNRIRTYLKNI